MTGDPPEFIFFPASPFEPVQVYLTSAAPQSKNIVNGSRWEKEARQENRWRSYPRFRCRPWSAELWAACLAYLERKAQREEATKAEYEDLQKKRRKIT